ncbi:hypothetical protein FGO68_gene13106 [Halteria grandinella]|uniref:non-specific serine/threonine protein kinase n=1 Tax=Halteria grandinella TaxID=5974 RepID=A0A8J8NT90_HALGN|nr:hypothetical protein FGO68_gene13106 [Halteria grandinella]
MVDSILKPVNEKYNRLHELGEGTFGKVYLAQNIIDKCNYALKIQKKYLDEEIMLNSNQQFSSEVVFLEQHHHPFIIKYIESFQYYDRKQNFNPWCIVYEQADPRNLFDMVKVSNKGIPEEQALTWFTQICLALSYMHESGHMHRDIKLSNILLVVQEDYLVAKIADFGSIKQDQESQENTINIGTKRFFSPERVGQDYTSKVDVWAMGILLYFMLTNQHPFPDIEREDYVEKLIDCELVCRKTISKPFQELIQWLLEKDPIKRPDMRQVLRNPLVKERIEIIKQDISNEEHTTTIAK